MVNLPKGRGTKSKGLTPNKGYGSLAAEGGLYTTNYYALHSIIKYAIIERLLTNYIIINIQFL